MTRRVRRALPRLLLTLAVAVPLAIGSAGCASDDASNAHDQVSNEGAKLARMTMTDSLKAYCKSWRGSQGKGTKNEKSLGNEAHLILDLAEKGYGDSIGGSD